MRPWSVRPGIHREYKLMSFEPPVHGLKRLCALERRCQGIHLRRGKKACARNHSDGRPARKFARACLDDLGFSVSRTCPGMREKGKGKNCFQQWCEARKKKKTKKKKKKKKEKKKKKKKRKKKEKKNGSQCAWVKRRRNVKIAGVEGSWTLRDRPQLQQKVSAIRGDTPLNSRRMDS